MSSSCTHSTLVALPTPSGRTEIPPDVVTCPLGPKWSLFENDWCCEGQVGPVSIQEDGHGSTSLHDKSPWSMLSAVRDSSPGAKRFGAPEVRIPVAFFSFTFYACRNSGSWHIHSHLAGVSGCTKRLEGHLSLAIRRSYLSVLFHSVFTVYSTRDLVFSSCSIKELKRGKSSVKVV